MPPARPSRRWPTSSCCSTSAARRSSDIVQEHRLPHRHPLPRAGLPGDRRAAEGVFPVSTGLVVSALARPEWLVEIDVDRGDPGAHDVLAGRRAAPAAGMLRHGRHVLQPGRRGALRARARRRRRGGVAERHRPARSGRGCSTCSPAGAGAGEAMTRLVANAPVQSSTASSTVVDAGGRTAVALGRAHARPPRAPPRAAAASRPATCSPTTDVPAAMVEAFERRRGRTSATACVAALTRRPRRRRRGGAGALRRPLVVDAVRLAGRRPARRLARRADRTSSRVCGESGSRSSTTTSRARSTPTTAPSYGVPGDE